MSAGNSEGGKEEMEFRKIKGDREESVKHAGQEGSMREEKKTKEGQCSCNYDHAYDKRKEEREILKQPTNEKKQTISE